MLRVIRMDDRIHNRFTQHDGRNGPGTYVLAGSLLLLPALLLAQSYTASVRGVVTDASEAAVPGAKVVITD